MRRVTRKPSNTVVAASAKARVPIALPSVAKVSAVQGADDDDRRDGVGDRYQRRVQRGVTFQDMC